MNIKGMEIIKQWVGDLLYENGLHQRETQIFDDAENKLEELISEHFTAKEDVKRFNEIVKEEIADELTKLYSKQQVLEMIGEDVDETHGWDTKWYQAYNQAKQEMRDKCK